MSDLDLSFYLNGKWVDARERSQLAVINPATESTLTHIAMGTADDVNLAVKAARDAFPAWSATSREERLAILDKIVAGIKARGEELAQAISQEMGAPISLSLIHI